MMQLDDVTISRAIIENFTEEFKQALDVEVAIGGAGPAGMAANTGLGAPRMGPIFGGMLLSGRRSAEVVIEILQQVKVS